MDHCFQDILTGDPFFFSYQNGSNKRAGNQHAVQAATMTRMLSHLKDHNIELVGSEKPRHSLVLRADFADLEIRKAKAASAWMREAGR